MTMTIKKKKTYYLKDGTVWDGKVIIRSEKKKDHSPDEYKKELTAHLRLNKYKNRWNDFIFTDKELMMFMNDEAVDPRFFAAENINWYDDSLFDEKGNYLYNDSIQSIPIVPVNVNVYKREDVYHLEKKPLDTIEKELKILELTPKDKVRLFNSYLDMYFPNLTVKDYSLKTNSFNIVNSKGTEFYCYYDSNKIFNRETHTVAFKVPHSQEQTNEIMKYDYFDVEHLRRQALRNIQKEIDISKKYNIILSNEGLGKSSLLPIFKKLFNRDTVVMAFKSYEQIRNRKETLLKNNPELTSEIIPGTDRLLNRHKVKERVYAFDEETGDMVLSFKRSVEASDLTWGEKTAAINEKMYYDAVASGETHKDIIFLTEEKLIHEISHKKNFKNHLIVFDEFNQDSWFSMRAPTEQEAKRIKNKPQMFIQNTWTANFPVQLAKIENLWYNFLKSEESKIIVLSTEQKVAEFFISNPQTFNPETLNIIDERRILPIVDKITSFNIVKSGLLNRENKNKLANALRLNDYIVVGNGINSSINNVSALGQNYHEEWNNQKIAILITQPSPDEIAPLMANLNLNSQGATLIKMMDTLNQLIGRAQGFRSNVNIKEMQVFLPDKYAYELLLCSRYLSINLVKNHFSDANNIVEKIIHTLEHEIFKFKKNHNLFLSSLKCKINSFVDNLILNINKLKTIPIKHLSLSSFKSLCSLYIEEENSITPLNEVFRLSNRVRDFYYLT